MQNLWRACLRFGFKPMNAPLGFRERLRALRRAPAARRNARLRRAASLASAAATARLRRRPRQRSAPVEIERRRGIVRDLRRSRLDVGELARRGGRGVRHASRGERSSWVRAGGRVRQRAPVSSAKCARMASKRGFGGSRALAASSAALRRSAAASRSQLSRSAARPREASRHRSPSFFSRAMSSSSWASRRSSSADALAGAGLFAVERFARDDEAVQRRAGFRFGFAQCRQGRAPHWLASWTASACAPVRSATSTHRNVARHVRHPRLRSSH